MQVILILVTGFTILASNTSFSAVLLMKGHWDGAGTAFSASGEEAFKYTVSMDNIALSLFKLQSSVRIKAPNGFLLAGDLNFIYEDKFILGVPRLDGAFTVKSEYGTGNGNCWINRCFSEIQGKGNHVFKATTYIKGFNKSLIEKEEYLDGKLVMKYIETYQRTEF